MQVYLAEIASPKLRGIFGLSTSLFVNLGLIVLYGVSGIPGIQYYNVVIVAIGIVVIFELLALWLPETPSYLFLRHKQAKSMCVLRWLRGTKVSIDREVEEMEAILSKKKTYCEALRMFSRKRLLYPLIIVVVLIFFIPASGQGAVVALAGPLLAQAGESNPNLAALYSVGIAGVLGTLLSYPVIDLAGRRPLLIVGGFGIMSGSAMLGAQFYLTRPSLCMNETNSTFCDSTEQWSFNDSDLEVAKAEITGCNLQYIPMAITALILIRFSNSFSWGPVGWIISSELFPLQVRGFANSIANSVYWTSAMIVGSTYLSYEKAVRPWFAVWTFSLLTLIGIVFIIVFVPETKGKSLEQIQEELEHKYHIRKAPKNKNIDQSKAHCI